LLLVENTVALCKIISFLSYHIFLRKVDEPCNFIVITNSNNFSDIVSQLTNKLSYKLSYKLTRYNPVAKYVHLILQSCFKLKLVTVYKKHLLPVMSVELIARRNICNRISMNIWFVIIVYRQVNAIIAHGIGYFWRFYYEIWWCLQ